MNQRFPEGSENCHRKGAKGARNRRKREKFQSGKGNLLEDIQSQQLGELEFLFLIKISDAGLGTTGKTMRVYTATNKL